MKAAALRTREEERRNIRKRKCRNDGTATRVSKQTKQQRECRIDKTRVSQQTNDRAATTRLDCVSERSQLVELRIQGNIGVRIKSDLSQFASKEDTTRQNELRRVHGEYDDEHGDNIENHENVRHGQTNTLVALRTLVVGVAEAASLLHTVIEHANTVSTANVALSIRVALYS